MRENSTSNMPPEQTVFRRDQSDIQAPTPSASSDADDMQNSDAKASFSAPEAGTNVDHTGKSSQQKKSKNSKTKRSRQKTTKQLLISLLIKIGVIALIIWGLFTFVLGITIHYGNNMHPMVRDGDLVFSLRLQRPYINAAVMYRREGKTDIGRVIALEGSTVNIEKGGVFTVNGSTPPEEIFYPTYPADGGGITFPYTVPEGKVFILNDFREDTLDSRSFGAVDVSDLKGVLLLTIRRRGF